VLEVPGLRRRAAPPRMLLPLKVLAHRVGQDEDDVRLLARELGLENAEQVLAVAEEVFGDRLEPARGSSSRSSSPAERAPLTDAARCRPWEFGRPRRFASGNELGTNWDRDRSPRVTACPLESARIWL
jgi:hypothetical protein